MLFSLSHKVSISNGKWKTSRIKGILVSLAVTALLIFWVHSNVYIFSSDIVRYKKDTDLKCLKFSPTFSSQHKLFLRTGESLKCFKMSAVFELWSQWALVFVLDRLANYHITFTCWVSTKRISNGTHHEFNYPTKEKSKWSLTCERTTKRAQQAVNTNRLDYTLVSIKNR
jgi:hypothetical protein